MLYYIPALPPVIILVALFFGVPLELAMALALIAYGGVIHRYEFRIAIKNIAISQWIAILQECDEKSQPLPASAQD